MAATKKKGGKSTQDQMEMMKQLQSSLLEVTRTIADLKNAQESETHVRKEREAKEDEQREEREREPQIIQVIEKRDNPDFERKWGKMISMLNPDTFLDEVGGGECDLPHGPWEVMYSDSEKSTIEKKSLLRVQVPVLREATWDLVKADPSLKANAEAVKAAMQADKGIFNTWLHCIDELKPLFEEDSGSEVDISKLRTRMNRLSTLLLMNMSKHHTAFVNQGRKAMKTNLITHQEKIYADAEGERLIEEFHHNKSLAEAIVTGVTAFSKRGARGNG